MNRVRYCDLITVDRNGTLHPNAHLSRKLKDYNTVNYSYENGVVKLTCCIDDGEYKMTRRKDSPNTITMGAKFFLNSIGYTFGENRMYDAKVEGNIVSFIF